MGSGWCEGSEITPKPQTLNPNNGSMMVSQVTLNPKPLNPKNGSMMVSQVFCKISGHWGPQLWGFSRFFGVHWFEAGGQEI